MHYNLIVFSSQKELPHDLHGSGNPLYYCLHLGPTAEVSRFAPVILCCSNNSVLSYLYGFPIPHLFGLEHLQVEVEVQTEIFSVLVNQHKLVNQASLGLVEQLAIERRNALLTSKWIFECSLTNQNTVVKQTNKLLLLLLSTKVQRTAIKYWGVRTLDS